MRRLGTSSLWPAVLVLAIAALVVAGCGGDDDDGGETTAADQPLTKADYIKQADEICAQNSLTVGQAARERFGSAQPTRDQALQFTQETVIPSTEQTLERLRALPAPKGDEQQLTATYDALEEAIDALKEDPNKAIEPNFAGVFDDANQRAQAYGFEQCGQS